MNGPSLEQMMCYMAQGRKEAFYVSIVIYTILAAICLAPLCILMWSRFADAERFMDIEGAGGDRGRPLSRRCFVQCLQVPARGRERETLEGWHLRSLL